MSDVLSENFIGILHRKVKLFQNIDDWLTVILQKVSGIFAIFVK